MRYMFLLVLASCVSIGEYEKDARNCTRLLDLSSNKSDSLRILQERAPGSLTTCIEALDSIAQIKKDTFK